MLMNLTENDTYIMLMNLTENKVVIYKEIKVIAYQSHQEKQKIISIALYMIRI